MIELMMGWGLGILFAIFFPKPFEKIKGWVLKMIKKCNHDH